MDSDRHLISEQGSGLGGMADNMPGSTFFDLTWEQNLTVADPLAEGSSNDEGVRYFVVIANPTNEQSPYYFVAQTIQDGSVNEVIKFTGHLDPGSVRYLPLKLWIEDEVLSLELVSLSRKNGGKLDP